MYCPNRPLVMVIVRDLFFVYTPRLVSSREVCQGRGFFVLKNRSIRCRELFVGFVCFVFFCSILHIVFMYVHMYKCLKGTLLKISHSFFSTIPFRQSVWCRLHCSHCLIYIYLTETLPRIPFVLSLEIGGSPTYLLIQLITA